jgi:hypothetical protein
MDFFALPQKKGAQYFARAGTLSDKNQAGNLPICANAQMNAN